MRKTWTDEELPVEHRVAEATTAIEAAKRLLENPDFVRLIEALGDEIEQRRDRLEEVARKIGESDDYHRGVIAGLRFVVAMPEATVEAAEAFITNA